MPFWLWVGYARSLVGVRAREFFELLRGTAFYFAFHILPQVVVDSPFMGALFGFPYNWAQLPCDVTEAFAVRSLVARALIYQKKNVKNRRNSNVVAFDSTIPRNNFHSNQIRNLKAFLAHKGMRIDFVLLLFKGVKRLKLPCSTPHKTRSTLHTLAVWHRTHMVYAKHA